MTGQSCVLSEFKNQRVAIDFEKSLEARPARKPMAMRNLIKQVG